MAESTEEVTVTFHTLAEPIHRFVTTALFSYPACETTYISEEMDTCSTCREPVTQIPTVRELARTTSLPDRTTT